MPDDPLQFDRAEFRQPGAGALSCAVCRTAICGEYYEANGRPVCPACRQLLEAGRSPAGGGIRFLRALLFGSLAAALGAGIYYAVLALTGYELGLVAIVVGLLVGAAVRAGSHRRGGWPYQTLAMALTYLAICSTYIPFIVEGLAEAREPTGSAQAEPAPEAPREPPSIAEYAFAIALLLVLACAAPFLAGLQNLIGLLIIGFALYEAWRLNRRTPLTITGPHAAGAAGTAPSHG